MRHLNPLTGENKSFLFGVIDIETDGFDGQFLYGGMYFDHTFKGFECKKAFVKEITSYKYIHVNWYAHNGGRFDFLHLFDELHAQGIKPKMIAQGSRLVELTHVHSKKERESIRFRDSIAILGQASLEKLAISFDVTRKQVGSIDFAGGEKFNPKNPKHVEYNKIDCIALHQVLQKFFSHEKIRHCNKKLTASSQSMEIFRREFQNQSILCTDDNIQNFCRESYFGGRTEVFKQVGHNLNLYDINSLYPSAMLKNLPLEYIGETNTFDGRNGFYRIEAYCPEMYIPVLPVKTAKGKLIFPTGYIKGVYHTSEIIEAMKHGYTINKVIEGKLFTESNEFFKDYINYWYDQRLKAKKGDFYDYTAKLFMNGLYGKFGQKEERKELTFEPKTEDYEPWGDLELFEKYGLYTETVSRRANFQLVHIAAAITAMARCMLLNYLKANERNVYYCDTDSAFLSCEIKHGSELGQMKLEKSGFSAKFRGPKNYLIKDNDKLTIKIKGMNGLKKDNISFENFLECDLVSQKASLGSFKESMRRFGAPIKMIDRTREVKTPYDKRIVLKNGDTRPLHINKIGEIK